MLALIAAVEAQSEHPLGAALIAFAESRGVVADAATARDVRALPGLGVTGNSADDATWIGNSRLLRHRAAMAPDVAATIERLKAAGLTTMACGSGHDVCAIVGAADTTRPAAVAAVADLRRLG